MPPQRPLPRIAWIAAVACAALPLAAPAMEQTCRGCLHASSQGCRPPAPKDHGVSGRPPLALEEGQVFVGGAEVAGRPAARRQGRKRTTDGDGRFKFRDVGTGVPFVIDVHAPRYVAATSRRFTVGAGGTRALDDIVLRDSGATVVACLRDRDGAPVRGVAVLLLADPASRAAETHGSWLHHRSYRQLKRTSSLGNVRFSGVPPGRVIVRARGILSAIEERASVSEGQELRLEMQVL